MHARAHRRIDFAMLKRPSSEKFHSQYVVPLRTFSSRIPARIHGPEPSFVPSAADDRSPPLESDNATAKYCAFHW